MHPGAPNCLPLGCGFALDSPVLGQWPLLWGASKLGWGSLHLSLHPRDASSGDWDTESCQTLETQAAHTRCQCQHLSTFAVLAQPPKDLVSRRLPGLGREEAPGLPAAICDSASRDLGDPACVSEQLYSGIAHGCLCPWDDAHSDDTCLGVCGGRQSCACSHVHMSGCVYKSIGNRA